MARSQFRSNKKVSGRKYISLRKKRLKDLGDIPALTTIGDKRSKTKRVRGANTKRTLLSTEQVIVSDKGKAKKLKILSVVDNPANINYTRRNIITKGCIVKTEKGDVKITSRPGQSGAMQGVFTN